jgi:hypothetical protein
MGDVMKEKTTEYFGKIFCKSCCETEFPLVGEGVGPHAGKLICVACGKFLRWIPKSDMADVVKNGK